MIPTTFDRFLPATLGFDRLFNALDHASDFITTGTNMFPPFNIIKEGENNYAVEMAVAGYAEDEIEVVAEKNSLKITGKKLEKKEEADRNYLVKGIAGRSFVRSFLLADSVVVEEAKLKDGILTIRLVNVVPEEQKVRKIPLVKLD